MHSCCVIVLPPWGIALSLRRLRIAGAHEADRVEPGVAEEAAVLDREHRLHQVVGQLLVAHAAALLAVLVEEVGDELGLERLLA